MLEIAERCQDAQATGSNIRPSTPRSAEAILRSGIDPEDLVHKTPQFFLLKTGDAELGSLAYQFHEECRQKRMDEIRILRQSLIEDGWQQNHLAQQNLHSNSNNIGASDMVEREQKRLLVLQNRCL